MAGIPRATYTPGPFQIFQSAGTVIIVYQDLHTHRYIPTAPGPQIDGADFWMGSSRRHWEEDTLVVDSISLIDETWFDRGTSHRAIHQVAGERRSAFLASPLEAALR